MDIQKIKDEKQIAQIIKKLFCKLPVHLQDADHLYPIKIVSYNNGLLQITHRCRDSATRLILLDHKEHWMLLECWLQEKLSANREIIKPVCLHLKRHIRREPRMQLDTGGPEAVRVLNVIPIKSFPDMFHEPNRIREQLVSSFQDRLRQDYPLGDIILLTGMRMDHRLQLLNKSLKPIYAPVLTEPRNWLTTGFVSFEDYIELYRREQPDDNVVSEISIPLTYRNSLMWGYFRVFAVNELGELDLHRILDQASELMREFEAKDLFPKSTEEGLVMDINKLGIGFSHPGNAHLSRYYIPGQEFVFDLKFPTGRTLSLCGTIKNTTMIGNNYRIGLEFQHPSASQMDVVKDFISSIESSG